ncbi:MAG TPA: LytR C-terminal domain-containing protein [Candidatus Acidoferrum sp.]|nr:LytR C-terminal domain-containing protein [Candidatus Acidoferrum sp.]
MNSPEKVSLPLIVKIQVVLAVLATIVTIALAAYIPTLVQRKSQLDSEIVQSQVQKKELEDQIVSLEKQKAESERLANAVSSALYAASPRQLQKTIDESLNSGPDSGVRPRIFVHIRAASQRPAAKQVADIFRQKGYTVPGIQILVETGPDETQVRYFHAPDETGAQAILSQLTAAGVKNVAAKPNLIAGHDDIRPHQYEIWFAPDSL